MALDDFWQGVYDKLPEMCSRQDVAQTGIVTVGTIANLTSQGKGIANGKKVAKKILYPRADVVMWLMQRG